MNCISEWYASDIYMKIENFLTKLFINNFKLLTDNESIHDDDALNRRIIKATSAKVFLKYCHCRKCFLQNLTKSFNLLLVS